MGARQRDILDLTNQGQKSSLISYLEQTKPNNQLDKLWTTIRMNEADTCQEKATNTHI